MYFEDTKTYFDKIVMFFHIYRRKANGYIEIYPAIIVHKWGLNALFILPKSKHFISVFNCFAEDLFTLTNDKFRMVYKVDGNPQLDSRDWSMYSNILKVGSHDPYFSSNYSSCIV